MCAETVKYDHWMVHHQVTIVTEYKFSTIIGDFFLETFANVELYGKIGGS